MKQYWKPEPKLYGLDFWALLIPAACYTIGVILFGGEAIKAGSIVGATQGFGSWLMVIGGEMGTLSSASEVFRKSKDGRANFADWFGIVVSLAATLGTLFVVFAKLSPLKAMWIEPVRNWGPLALLLCSGLDFYANVMELAFFRAHFDEMWTQWNDARHNYEQAAQTRDQKRAEIEQVEQETAPVTLTFTELSTDARRAALVGAFNDNPHAKSDELAPMFGVSASTIRRDLGILEESGHIRRNGHKTPVKTEVKQ